MTTTADIKESLSQVAASLSNIKRLTKSAKKYCARKYSCGRSTRNQDREWLQSHIPTRKPIIGKKASCSSIETASRELYSYDQSVDLAELLDRITTQYNEQIGSLVGNIEKMSTRLAQLQEENQFLRKCSVSNQKSDSRSILRTPMLTEQSEKRSPKVPVTLKKHTASLLLFKRVGGQRDTSLRKIRAAPQVNSQFDKFQKKINLLQQPPNGLCKYL